MWIEKKKVKQEIYLESKKKKWYWFEKKILKQRQQMLDQGENNLKSGKN